MTFNLVFSRPHLSVFAQSRLLPQSKRAPIDNSSFTTPAPDTDTKPFHFLVAEKGSPIIVFVKYLNADSESLKQPVYSLFVGGQLFEAMPTTNWQTKKYKRTIKEFDEYTGVCYTKISTLNLIPTDNAHEQIVLANGPQFKVYDPERKLKEGVGVVLLWSAQSYDDKFKLLTQQGSYEVMCK
jgi:hypothetical protein